MTAGTGAIADFDAFFDVCVKWRKAARPMSATNKIVQKMNKIFLRF